MNDDQTHRKTLEVNSQTPFFTRLKQRVVIPIFIYIHITKTMEWLNARVHRIRSKKLNYINKNKTTTSKLLKKFVGWKLFVFLLFSSENKVLKKNTFTFLVLLVEKLSKICEHSHKNCQVTHKKHINFQISWKKMLFPKHKLQKKHHFLTTKIIMTFSKNSRNKKKEKQTYYKTLFFDNTGWRRHNYDYFWKLDNYW